MIFECVRLDVYIHRHAHEFPGKEISNFRGKIVMFPIGCPIIVLHAALLKAFRKTTTLISVTFKVSSQLPVKTGQVQYGATGPVQAISPRLVPSKEFRPFDKCSLLFHFASIGHFRRSVQTDRQTDMRHKRISTAAIKNKKQPFMPTKTTIQA